MDLVFLICIAILPAVYTNGNEIRTVLVYAFAFGDFCSVYR